MRALLDTNVLVRHLTHDPPDQGAAASQMLAEADDLVLTDLVLAELIYVLESFYNLRRPRIAALARSVITFDTITVDDEQLLLRAVEVYETGRIDFAEAYLVARAEATGITTIATFDRAVDRITTVTRLDPLSRRSGPRE